MKFTWFCRLAFFIAVVNFSSCQKEVSLQDDNPSNPPGSGGGSGGNMDKPGWSFTGSGNTNYYGCVDTAYYEDMGTVKALVIDVIDSAGSSLTIAIASPNKITTTTYTPVQGATILFTTDAGDTYIATTPSSFSFKVTSINDTLITAEFSASLNDPLGGGTFSITKGKLKALIGKHNECTIGDTDPVDPGGGTDQADYYLLDGPGECANADLKGTYIKDSVLTTDHNVTLDVYVDVPGKWNASTTTVNGIKFSGSGDFTSTGTNSITLQATGKPVATGSFELPLTAGSSTCKLIVDVDTIELASCDQPNNSFTFDVAGISDGSISFVGSRVTGGVYEITGNGTGGDLRFEFPGDTQPAPGVYKMKLPGGSYLYGEVGVYLVASNIWWQPHEGKVYVSIVNGKVVATFCDVEFSGSLGGPSYKSKVSAKITER